MADNPKQEKKPPTSVDAHYIKGGQFRVIHVDGVWGGLAPNGLIHAAFWSQRAAIPQLVEYAVKSEGGFGSEIRREGRSGIVREVDVDAVFSVEFARVLRDWLDEKIADYERIQRETTKSE